VIRFHGSDTYFVISKKEQNQRIFGLKKVGSKASAFIVPTTFAGTLPKKLFAIKTKS
jgi:hypothetical protein